MILAIFGESQSTAIRMLRAACNHAGQADRVHFKVLVDVNGNGRHELVQLWALCGPGDDLMLEGED